MPYIYSDQLKFKMLKYLSIICIFFFLISSCATYNKYERYNAVATDNYKEKELDQRFVVLGNLGKGDATSRQESLSSLDNYLQGHSDDKTTVLFLGNNVNYNQKSDGELEDAVKEQLQPIINLVKESGSQTIFLPGSDDWSVTNQDLRSEQEKLIQDELGKEYFYPNDGCPLKTVDISDEIVLVLIDADWYIRDWDKFTKINKDCTINSKSFFLLELSNTIRKNRGKTTIVAMSRPVFSNGEHGGNYSAKSNLTPLPVIGNVKNLARKTGGFSQNDLSHRNYTSLRTRLISLAQQNNKVVFLSAHETNLQYLLQNEIPQIISGSTTKTTPVKKKDNTRFSYAERGFAVYNVFKDGSSNVEFFPLASDQPTYIGDVFRSKPEEAFAFQPMTQDSIESSIFTKREAKKGGIYRFIIGNRYRKLYGMDLLVPVTDLDTISGGLTVTGLGGGHQTESLHSEDSQGNRYTFRGMKKRSTQYIQTVTLRDFYMEDQLEETIASKLVQDFFTGSYPFSATLVEQLIKPVNLPTRHSEIKYVPKQKAIGQFNKYGGDKLYSLEYPNIGYDFKKQGDGYTSEVYEGKDYGTFDLVQQIRKDSKHQLDQEAYVRARLFDMLIGDWDRHQDQWKWLEFKDGKDHIYYPFPQDRDQAFSKLDDGLAAKISYLLFPESRIIESYSSKLKAIRKVNKEPFPLDISFLSKLSLDDWLEQAQFIQSQLTDEVIDVAFADFVKQIPEADTKDLAKIKSSLLGRRNQLESIAKRYYHQVSKYPKVLGTNESDYFQFETLPNKRMKVSIFDKKNKENGDPYFEREFSRKDTKEIWVYGLQDSDHFEVIGKRSPIKLNLVGGHGKDHYVDKKNGHVTIFDFKTGEIDMDEAKRKAHKHIRNEYNVNNYDLEYAYQGTELILPTFGANQDDGVQLGAVVQLSKQRFKGISSSSFRGQYFTSTKGAILNYRGSLPEVVGRYSLNLDASLNSENYSKNFFGYGNDSQDLQSSEGYDYNRVYFSNFEFSPSLSRGYYSGWSVLGGLTYNNIQLKDSLNGFVQNNPDIPSYLFNRNSFVGVKGNLSYKNRDYKAFTTNGFYTNLGLLYNKNITENNKGYFRVQPDLGLDVKLIGQGNLIFATQLHGDAILGEDYEFFQAVTLGGNEGLRGFRNDRFFGQYAMSQTTDLRYVFNRFRTAVLPMRFGLYSGVDYGRVWGENDTSRTWHNSLGGGFILGVADSATITFGMFRTSDRFTKSFLSMGFDF